MAMETRATISRLDLICEALGVSSEKLAKRAKLTCEDLSEAYNGHWRPTTIGRLSEYLGVSPDFFDIPTEHLAELLKAFSVVEPWYRFKLIDKIWTIETVWSAMEEYAALSNPSSLRLIDLMEEYGDRGITGHRSFVAFVRQELERSRVLVFSHPFGHLDYTAILFVPGERISPFKYLVVNEIEWLSPLTNALFQWYEVLRLLSRRDDTDDENGFSIDPEASWSAVYLEPTVDGYCPRLNEQLRKRFILHDFSVIFFGDSFPGGFKLKEYWWRCILHALMEGLPPAVIAEYFSHSIEFDYEANDDDFASLLNQPTIIDEIVKQIVRPMNQPKVIDDIVKQIVQHRIVPMEYDWIIPSYPSFIRRLVINAAERYGVSKHIMLRALSTSEDDYAALLERVERLDIHNLSTEQ